MTNREALRLMSSRLPRKSQIGHLTLKSSVYAPTAMSHMGQDLVMNHMQSHYRRIVSAKASVDTSAPKSMRMHIKVRDQKKRASLNRRDIGPLSSRQDMSRSSSVASIAPPREESKGSARNEQKPRSSTPLESSRPQYTNGVDHRFNSSRMMDYSSPRHDRDRLGDSPNGRRRKHQGPYNDQRSSKLSDSDHEWDEREQRSPRDSFQLEGDGGRNLQGRDHLMQTNKFGSLTAPHQPRHQRRIKHRMTPESTFNDNDLSLDLQQSDDEYETATSKKLPSRFRNSQLHYKAALDPEELSFSYKGPPSARREPNTINIWEEEQLYLKFISDVTTDILARGVFSNRVLQQVFDSHVERRKHQLDEERMREMIDQLKEDLNITS